ncbi:spore maturation protein B [Clostridia bacterium]|nr:spore maturation protein B [Clostridia bacterium]
MKFVLFLSEAIIPLLIFYIIATGISKKQDIYDNFVKGAADGFRTVLGIMPTLIGLMVAVGILRASGFLTFFSSLTASLMSYLHFPEELIPLTIIKMVSSSAATGLLLDLYKEHGPDSTLGTMASLMMSSTETIFYTMSIYFMAAKVSKSRYTLAGALFCSLMGIIASVVLAGCL